MAGQHGHLVSSTSRPLRLRRRRELWAERQSFQGKVFWVVKDPVSLKYFRFHEEEYTLLEMLDGKTGLEQLRRRFEQRFAPQKITLEELTTFVGSLHSSGLVVADSPRQGDELWRRRGEVSRRELVAKVSNVLAIRFQGFDPDRLLGWLNGWIGWIFSVWAIRMGLAVCLAALLLVTIQFDAFAQKLPAFDEFFAMKNWFWLALTLAGTKILHEFGHGLACKRLGGECHEMGVMFLVLTPCLYVNVSDSWMLPSKWHRAAIAVAGIYVELILAACCSFLWWFTEPGLLNYLCLNVMFVSSISTVLFNANPLMRYDGYYILADLLEIPNLRSKSSTVLRNAILQGLLGIEAPHDPFLPQRNQFLFAMFTVAAAAYRWVICFSILWFLQSVFQPYGLQAIGQLLAVAAFWGLVVQPAWQLLQFLHVPGRFEKMNMKRALACVALLLLLVATALMTPLPYYVECPFVIQPRDARSVYVDVPGRIDAIHVQPGQVVQQGTKLVSLASLDVEMRLAQVTGQREVLASRVDDLRRRQFVDPAAAMEISAAEESLRAMDAQLAQRQRDRHSLTLTAPVAGQVIEPPRRPKRTGSSGDELETWHGSPLERHNLQATLDAGVMLCQIGDQRKLVALIDIDQSEVEMVRTQQTVKMKFQNLPCETFAGHIGEIAQLEVIRGSTQASSATNDTSSADRTLITKYQASVPVDDSEGVIFPGTQGTARIRTANLTLAQRLWRYASQTFRLSQ